MEFVSKFRGMPPYLLPIRNGSDWLDLMHDCSMAMMSSPYSGQCVIEQLCRHLASAFAGTDLIEDSPLNNFLDLDITRHRFVDAQRCSNLDITICTNFLTMSLFSLVEYKHFQLWFLQVHVCHWSTFIETVGYLKTLNLQKEMEIIGEEVLRIYRYRDTSKFMRSETFYGMNRSLVNFYWNI